MGEMADQNIEDGMLTPCDYCGAEWTQECDSDCELSHPPKIKTNKKAKGSK